jgi:cytidylate kinase
MSLITITSPFAAGGEEIAKRVAEKLNLEVYDDQKLLDLAPEAGIDSQELQNMRDPGFFDRLFSSKPQSYMEYMNAIVYEVSRRGSGVIIGHGSQMLLQDFGCALHVCIKCDDDARIDRLVAEQGLKKNAALSLIHKMDSRRRGRFRHAFGRDLDDSSLYDLIINCSKLGNASAADIIIETAQADEIVACSLTALESMEKLSLTKRIQAALIKNDLDDNMLIIHVSEKGIAELSGITPHEDILERIIEVTRQVPGVSDVRSEIVVAPNVSV